MRGKRRKEIMGRRKSEENDSKGWSRENMEGEESGKWREKE